MVGPRRESSLTIDTAWLLAARTVSFIVSLALPFGRVLGVTRSDLSLTKDMGKLSVAAAAGAVIAAVIRANMLGAKPLVILLVCGAAFSMVYILAILLLRVPSLEEKRQVLDRLMPMLPASLRLRRTQP